MTLTQEVIDQLPEFKRRLERLPSNSTDLKKYISYL